MDATHYCTQCGNPLEPDTQFCSKCGISITKELKSDHFIPDRSSPTAIKSKKSAKIALLLCVLLGFFGAHRFYVNKIGTGLLMLLSCGGLGIWVIVDIILIINNKFEDKKNNPLNLTSGLPQYKKNLLIAGSILIWLIMFALSILSLVFYVTSGLVNVVNQELNSLKAGDIQKAYSYTSKDFQKATSLESFKQFIEHYPSLKNNKSYFFNERIIENNRGVLKGTLTANDGAQTPVEFQLIQEDGTWKIIGIKVIITGAGIQMKR